MRYNNILKVLPAFFSIRFLYISFNYNIICSPFFGLSHPFSFNIRILLHSVLKFILIQCLYKIVRILSTLLIFLYLICLSFSSRHEKEIRRRRVWGRFRRVQIQEQKETKKENFIRRLPLTRFFLYFIASLMKSKGRKNINFIQKILKRN